MEDTKGGEITKQQDKPAENIDFSIEGDQTVKQQHQQNNDNDNDDSVVYHSLMNAAPATQEVEETSAPEEVIEVELKPKPVLEKISGLEPTSSTEMVAKTNLITNSEREEGQQGNNSSESHQEQPEHNVVSTNNNIDLPITSTQQANENVFKSSTLGQSVDAQMEKVIDDIVELGGFQQFGQALESQDGIIDKEKEVQDIRREIIGDGNINIKEHEPVETHHNQLDEKEQNSHIEAEKPNDMDSGLPEISDLSSLQHTNLEQIKEKEEKLQKEKQKEREESHKNESLEGKQQRHQGNEHPEEEQQQPQSTIKEIQRVTDEGQQLSENSSPVDEFHPISVSNEQEKTNSSIEAGTPKKANDTANVDSDVADSIEEDLRDRVDVKKVISTEKESSEQQIEKQGRKQRRGSPKKIASATDQGVEENKIEETAPEPEVRAERRSSRRIKSSSKAKDEEEVVEEPQKPTRRKKEENEPKMSKDLTEDKDVSMDEEPENEPTEFKDDDKAKEIEKQAKGVRRVRLTRKSMPAELPKVKLERKPMKRTLEREDSHDKSLQPKIKTPARSVGSSARSITASFSTSKIDRGKSRSSSDFEDKAYKCFYCQYGTDRINNIVYHKMKSCSYIRKCFDESVEKWKQELQSPKSNNKRSSR